MSDDKSKRGPQDRSRVNVNESWELRYWTEEFKVSEDTLRAAVEEVGPMVEAVRKKLGK